MQKHTSGEADGQGEPRPELIDSGIVALVTLLAYFDLPADAVEIPPEFAPSGVSIPAHALFFLAAFAPGRDWPASLNWCRGYVSNTTISKPSKGDTDMARNGTSTEEIIQALLEAEVRLGQVATVGKICLSLGVSEQTHYKWRREYVT